MQRLSVGFWIGIVLLIGAASPISALSGEAGLVGHWKLRGDCRDSSGHENHGVNHGVQLDQGSFNGADSYIEIPSSNSLKLGAHDFTFAARIYTDELLKDVVGDVFDLYDPILRRGVTLTINSGGGNYQCQGTDRHVHFGIDNARATEWQDRGHPNPASNYVSNSLTVYKGKLYAATSGGKDPKDWRHVYRYEFGESWTDCGQVGDGKLEGVGPLIVHNGDLYAVTTTIDFTRIGTGDYDPGRVYRYLGGTQWQDCGQPSENRTLNCIASYQGKLYVGGGPEEFGVFVSNGDGKWRPSKLFSSRSLPRGCFPHAMCRHNGKLFVAYPGAYSFDGDQWAFAGTTLPAGKEWFLQTHCMGIFQGNLHAGTWPGGQVTAYQGGEEWRPMGRVGQDAMEVQALTVYNGKLYGGSIPRAEVCRYDGKYQWTSLMRFYSPEDYDPGRPGKMTRKQVNEASRITSLTAFNGQLFASTGSSTGSALDAPAGVRGNVYSMEAGKVASYDHDLGAGWKHLVAMRENDRLKLYVDGRLVAQSASFDPSHYDLSTDRPLRLGFGETEYFDGKMADVRLYNRALTDQEIKQLTSAP